MKKEELYFDSRDGVHKLHAVRYIPEEGGITGVVQIVHGMTEYVERYEEFAEYLVRKGFVVTGNDHLGHGKSVAEGEPYGYFCEQDPATVLVRDVHRLKKLTQTVYPDVPYIILGHSMGSFILRNYLCRYGTGIDGAIILGTGMQPKAALGFVKALVGIQKCIFGSKHVCKMIDKMVFGFSNKYFRPNRTSADWLSRNTENVDRYIADPLCSFVFTANGFSTLFELISRVWNRENLEKIPQTLPIFIASGGDDPVGEFGKGVQRTYDSLKDVGVENIVMKLYDKDRHEVLKEDDREFVMQDIYNWMMNTIIAKKDAK